MTDATGCEPPSIDGDLTPFWPSRSVRNGPPDLHIAALDIPRAVVSSGLFDPVRPGGALVVENTVTEAAVEDADKPVG